MNQLLGEFPCKIDPKGRLRLPSALLDQLAADERDNFVVNRGMEKCLMLYPKKVWDEKSAQVNQLNDFDEKARIFKRAFYRGATPMKKDSADRLNFPNQLLEWAGVGDGEVVLAAVQDKIEVWAAKEYEAQLDKELDMSSLAQDVLGNKNGG
ncbi:MAG: division/cell wall cluster transcriptional repressor MraZ [Lewinellaceae bacterium]|nr:division/cell wall cluster transcriptional repressor MraZ [Saprospiraceae bacterium]MCB9341074.1 division/cell wall cluster transcriptional repressor MraZ [Lewinellaceae bacterium]